LPDEALARLRRILVPVDGSTFAEYALTWALEVAHRGDASVDLVFVNVLPPSIVLGDALVAGEWEQSARTHAESYLDGLAARLARDRGIEVRTTVLRDASAARALARHARTTGAGLTVMTTHGRRGPARLWIGSVAEAFIRQSASPVLLLRADAADSLEQRRERLFHRVLVALDGSRNADCALEQAAMFSGFDGGSLELLRVIDPLPLAVAIPLNGDGARLAIDAERERQLDYLETRARLVRLQGTPTRSSLLVDTNAAEAILRHARKGKADLVVVGTRGRKGIGRVLLGSVAEAVVRGTTGPVLVVPSAFSCGGMR
jgi:nucleotide-binding universal stress UspA family protein